MARLRDLFGGVRRRAKYIRLPGVGPVPHPRDLGDYLAESLSSVWAAVSLIAGHMSSVPLHLYRRLPNGGREQASGHPIDNALRWESSPGVSAIEMREALIANIELHEVGYVMATFTDGRLNLRVFNSLHVRPDSDRQVYVIDPDQSVDRSARRFEVPAEIMITFPAMTFDAKNPIHVNRLRKRSINLAINYEERARAYNDNGMNPSGVVTWGDGWHSLKEEQQKRLEKKFEELYQGVSNAGGVAFMPSGSSFNAISLNPEQLQMLGARLHGVQEVARWFGISPVKIGDLSHATFSNIEHLNIHHVQDALLRRATKMEAIWTIALIPPEKRNQYFIEHNLDGLLRGDFKTRMDGYGVAKTYGLRTTNQIAAMENWNPVPAEDGGDTYYMPLNMIPTKQLEQMLSDRFSGQPRSARTRDVQRITHSRVYAEMRRRITDQYRPVFKTTAQKLVDKEVGDIRAAAVELLTENKLDQFKAFVSEYYLAFADDVRNGFAGLLGAYEQEITPLSLDEIASRETVDLSDFLANYARGLATRWTASSRGQIHDLVNTAVEKSESPADAVEQRISEWSETKAEKTERNEPIRAEGALSKAAWSAVGVRKIRWNAMGDACPYCLALDGAVIEIEQNFLGAGTALQPEGAQPFVSITNIGHPGLHDGCNCGISAEM